MRTELLQLLSRSMKVDVAAYKLATGKIEKAEQLWPAGMLEKARKIMQEAGKQWWSVEQLDSVPVDQPFWLYIAAGVLREAKDPDWRILIEGKFNYAEGLPLGCNMRLPRTPAVFARKTRWRKYDSSEDDFIKENYASQ